jgi:hypothetical protein
MDIDLWLNYITNKKKISIKLDDDLNDFYNKQTNLNYIISFDIEFIRLSRNNQQLQTVNEMGGIIFCKINNFWYLNYLFHFNLPPQHKHINELYLMMTKYNTLSKKTEKKNIELENKLLDYFKPSILTKKNKKYCFKINGYSLKDKIKHDLFVKIINNIFNDKEYKKRLIIDDVNFMKLTVKLFNKSFLIVKGEEDFKALNNQLVLLNVKKKFIFKNYFDIAFFNNFLFKKCGSAELEKSYYCLENLGFTKTFNKYLEIIITFTKLKAHNPLIDSYLTWIIYNIFSLNKINI